MATTERAFMAGFMAALKMYETEDWQEVEQRPGRSARPHPGPEQERLGTRALESYLAIPTFIRRGRVIGAR